MSIEAINTGYGGSSDSGETSSSNSNMGKVGMDEFLTLFIAQIKNQDPLNPLDSAEFTSQLAQFTSVEQLFGMNNSLGEIKETLNKQSEQGDILGFIGKTVKTDDNSILVGDGMVQSGSFNIEDSGDVTVNVFDGQGLSVRKLYLGPMDNGEHDVNWDGRDDAGKMVGDGTYTFEVIARDENGHYIPANTHISGEITGVTYKYGQPYLMIGDRIIGNASNIIEVSQTTAKN